MILYGILLQRVYTRAKQLGATEEIVEEKVVSQQRIRINGVGRGVQQYFPITFTDWYFSVLKTVINTSLINIVYKSIPIPITLMEYGYVSSGSPGLRDSGGSIGNSPKSTFRRSASPAMNSSGNGNSGSGGYSGNGGSGGIGGGGSSSTSPIQSRNYSQQLQLQQQFNLANYYFNNTDGDNNQMMSDRYQEIQSYLVETYCRTVDRYKKLLLLLKSSQQGVLGDLVNIPPLNIPPLTTVTLNNTWKSARTPTSTVKSPRINNNINNNNNTQTTNNNNNNTTTTTTTTSTTATVKSTNNNLASVVTSEIEKLSIADDGVVDIEKERKTTATVTVTADDEVGAEDIDADNEVFSSSFGSIASGNGTIGSSVDSSAVNSPDNKLIASAVAASSSSSQPSSTKSSIGSLNDLEEIPIWKRIFGNLQKIADQLYTLWENYVKIFLLVAREHCFKLALQYENKCIERWDRRTQHTTLHIQDLHDLLLVDSSQQLQQLSSPPTSSFIQAYFQFKQLKIESIPVKMDSVYDSLPIFFEHKIKFHQFPTSPVKECDLKRLEEEALKKIQEEQEQITEELNQQHLSASSKRFMFSITNTPGRHLFVFVHGLSGNSYDLRQFKNYFSIHFPMALYLICSSIEENTLDDIQQLGEKIATEVSGYLQDNLFYNITRISFVGHSLGGIVVRSALTSNKLKEHLSKLHTYVSLSSPHLGVKFSGSNLVPSAMWVWQKFSSSTCLKQLLMQDTNGPLTDCFLYKLSESKSLEHFKFVILVGSEQDGYVPFHSARIELPKESLKDKSRTVVKKMLQNILSPIKDKPIEYSKYNLPIESMIKLNVIFESHKGVDGYEKRLMIFSVHESTTIVDWKKD
ncbi:hypothetical protein PPL_04467 [Heterostelium album PN500]|uniref:DUF676 domain-containing protein n=1 Tax=Heterostelium pallidum (strain ATCC 26659 / Pp 5 / PN500) TaxID=670386 RepID=D3B7M9_HETP5|nr:hypothetical protein PPL_04467 [Heterostelium album PN500]EFA82772.1 hypothetical protein PPL_04467 [Heterostelium album PN500]|eukprot:XP_020434889.1 hypothetical protein PPL_04467 [Heterostelium album PN500]